MNLTRYSELYKKSRPFLGVGIIILSLLVLIYLKYFVETEKQKTGPKITPPSISQNPNQDLPKEFKFPDATSITIPQQLPVYQTSLTDLNDQEYRQIAAIFGITDAPTLTNKNTHDGTQLIWQQSGSILTISQTNLMYSSYTKSIPKPALTLTELKNVAESLIAKISILDKSLQLDLSRIIFIKTRINAGTYEDELTSADSFEDAEYIEFNFLKNLSDSPVYYGPPDASFLQIRLAKDGRLVQLTSRIFKDFTPAENYNLKSPQEAIAEVKNGQGKIVQTLFPDKYGQAFEIFRTQPAAIENLDVQHISIAYYLPSNPTEYIQPVFVFEGIFNYKPDQIGRAIIYLPAIKNQ